MTYVSTHTGHMKWPIWPLKNTNRVIKSTTTGSMGKGDPELQALVTDFVAKLCLKVSWVNDEVEDFLSKKKIQVGFLWFCDQFVFWMFVVLPLFSTFYYGNPPGNSLWSPWRSTWRTFVATVKTSSFLELPGQLGSLAGTVAGWAASAWLSFGTAKANCTSTPMETRTCTLVTHVFPLQQSLWQVDLNDLNDLKVSDALGVSEIEVYLAWVVDPVSEAFAWGPCGKTSWS